MPTPSDFTFFGEGGIYNLRGGPDGHNSLSIEKPGQMQRAGKPEQADDTQKVDNMGRTRENHPVRQLRAPELILAPSRLTRDTRQHHGKARDGSDTGSMGS